MDELLRLLDELGINPDDPPGWEEICRRADQRSVTRAQELGHLALSLMPELHADGRLRLLLTLFEAGCRRDAGRDNFEQFPPAVVRYLESGIPPGRGITPVAVTLLTRALCDPHLDPASEGWTPELPRRVRLGLDDFFLSRAPGEVHPFVYDRQRFYGVLDRLGRVPDFGPALQTDVFVRWMGAMNLLHDFDHLRFISEDYLAYHFIDIHDSVFNPYGGDRRPTAPLVERYQAAHCLAFWLRGAGEARRPSETLFVARAAELVLGTLEEVRSGLDPADLAAFDRGPAWGYFAWATEAAARAIAPGPHRAHLARLLTRNLEMFSGRMAVNRQAGRPAPGAATNGATNPAGEAAPLSTDGARARRTDPSPDDDATRSGLQWRPGMNWGTLFTGGGASSATVAPVSGQVGEPEASWSINPHAYHEVGDTPDFAEWGTILPPGTAFLGGYELPHSHRPIVTLVARLGDRVVYDVAVGETSESVQPSKLRDLKCIVNSNHLVSETHVRALQYQQTCDEVWVDYNRDLGRGRADALPRLAIGLCERMFRFHFGMENDEFSICAQYGVLVDEVVDGVRRHLTETECEALAQSDLVFCPRGPLAAAVPALVGHRHRLANSFRSVTATPSLGFFSYLHRRAATAAAVGPVPRVNIASWFPAPPGPAHRLASRAARELAGDTGLWLAADAPMATVTRTARMADRGEWSLVFAHGYNNPTSVQLADGRFPIDLPPCQPPPPERSNGGSVLFLLSCVAGRMIQTAPFVDSFGSITDEVLLSFCLTDRLARPPSLVGSFTQVVEARAAVDLGVDLVRHRLAARGQSPPWSQFSRALQQLVLRELSGSPAATLLTERVDGSQLSAWARTRPMDFLRLYARLHFRLIGCEPRLLAP